MKRLYPYIVALSIFSIMCAPAIALAAEPITLGKILTLAEDVFTILGEIAILIAIGFLVYGGFVMATAGSDSGRFTEGKNVLTNAMIGLAIILGAGIIIATISAFADNPFNVL